jgi:pimeloyl-ACP methyl ester carboxylesterase
VRFLKWLALLVLLLALAGFVAYRVKDPEKHSISDEARRQAPGRFVRLSQGVTHYEIAGPDSGDVVVLAAAFSVPAYLSDSLYQGLADSGFRVLRFDYYGRGWSDRPDVSYDLETFSHQLDELLDSLGIVQPIALGGLSFGAAIVTDYTTKHPGRVRSLIYVDPVFNTGRQLRKEERSSWAWSYYNVFKGGSEAMAQGQLDDFFHPERQRDWVARYRVGQQWKGTRESLRRTRAQIALAPSQGPQIRQLGQDPRPVLIVWGKQDSGAPFSESPALLAMLPRATLVPVDSAGHLPHIEQPQVVIPAVVNFLRNLRRKT